MVQGRLRELREKFVKNTLVQLTLRRWEELLKNTRLHLILVAIVLVGTVMDPFGMDQDRSLGHRFIFSLTSILTLTGMGILIIPPVRIFFEMKGVRRSTAIVLACVIANFLMVPMYLWLLSTVFGQLPPHVRVMELFVLVSLIIIFLSYRVLGLKLSNRTPQEGLVSINEGSETVPCYANPEKCAVQAKIPTHKRGTILSMVAQDHYVQVNTDKGSELVLMRLSDAVDLCDSKYGIRIHRSAWVSREGIKTLKKDSRKTLVVAPCGRELPVSRSAEKRLHRFLENRPNGGNLPANA